MGKQNMYIKATPRRVVGPRALFNLQPDFSKCNSYLVKTEDLFLSSPLLGYSINAIAITQAHVSIR